jgi:hypothetical protein
LRYFFGVPQHTQNFCNATFVFQMRKQLSPCQAKMAFDWSLARNKVVMRIRYDLVHELQTHLGARIPRHLLRLLRLKKTPYTESSEARSFHSGV